MPPALSIIEFCLSAPNQYNPNQIFSVGDGFGFVVFDYKIKPIDKVGFKCYTSITYRIGKYLEEEVFGLKNFFETLVRANFRFGRMCGC